MHGNTMPSCCGVCELQEFYSYTLTEEQALQHLKAAILDYCLEDASFSGKANIPNMFIAVTQKEGQKTMTPAFKALGFRAREFNSQEDPDRKLLFWTRRGLPRKLRSEILKQVKEHNDNW